MRFIRSCFLFFIFLNVSTAYNVKKVLRLGQDTSSSDDDKVSVLLVDTLEGQARIEGPDSAPEKPVLRHHIAHFCPNLDIARQCIRACMDRGKMAFCGKDHVCYCGHRYTAHDTSKVAVADAANQFRDLYLKYFGNPAFPAGEENTAENYFKWRLQNKKITQN